MGEPDIELKTVEEAIQEAEASSPGGGNNSGPGVGDSPSPEPPPIANGEDVIALLEMGLTGSFAAICGLQRIPWDANIAEMAGLAEAEKAALRPYAGYVAPYIPKMMAHQDKLGILFFGLIAFKTIRGKFSILKEYMERRPPEGFPQPEGAYQPSPPDIPREGGIGEE